MRLSEAGELGLLRELEARGLIVGTEHDAAELADGLVVTQDALVEGVHFRLDWLSWRELGFRAAAVTLSDLVRLRRAAGGALRDADAAGRRRAGARARALRGVRRARVFPCAAATRRAPAASSSASPRSVASDRVPGRAGARPGDQLVVTGPLGAAGAAFRQGRYVRPPLRTRGRAAARRRGRRDARRLRRDRGRRRSPRAPLRLSPRDRPRRRAAGRRAGRPRLRRGLRAARRDARSARLPGHRPLSRRARASSCCTTASRTTCPATNTSLRGIGFSRTKLTADGVRLRAQAARMGDRALPRPHALHVRPLLRHPGQQRADPARLQGRPGDDAARDGRDRRRLDRPRVRLLRLARRARRLRRLAAQPAAGGSR